MADVAVENIVPAAETLAEKANRVHIPDADTLGVAVEDTDCIEHVATESLQVY